MNKTNKEQKPIYVAPESTVIDIEMEGCVMTGSQADGQIKDYTGGVWGEPWVDNN